MQYTITLSDVADEEVRQAILVPLVGHNDSKAGPGGYLPLVLALKDSTGANIGGLWGMTSYGWLFVHLLAVPEPLRGQGVGTELMRQAEQEAVTRGCRGAYLDTFEFQARGFYERLGYRCFGELPDFPTGFSRFFMTKSIGA